MNRPIGQEALILWGPAGGEGGDEPHPVGASEELFLVQRSTMDCITFLFELCPLLT